MRYALLLLPFSRNGQDRKIFPLDLQGEDEMEVEVSSSSLEDIPASFPGQYVNDGRGLQARFWFGMLGFFVLNRSRVKRFSAEMGCMGLSEKHPNSFPPLTSSCVELKSEEEEEERLGFFFPLTATTTEENEKCGLGTGGKGFCRETSFKTTVGKKSF